MIPLGILLIALGALILGMGTGALTEWHTRFIQRWWKL